MAKYEWYGCLYLKDGAPCIPGFVVEAALTGKNGPARKVKSGQQAVAGIMVPEDAMLEYDGPKDLEALYNDERFQLRARVNIKGSRIVRVRPVFKEWSATITVVYKEGLLNESTVIQWMDTLGEEVGLMDWRPRFGRFSMMWNH